MSDRAAKLVMVAPAPVEAAGVGRLRLDAKFLSGMAEHVAQWAGPVEMILWRSGPIPFGREVAAGDLGFALTVLEPGQPLEAGRLAGADLVYASADMSAALGLGPVARAAGARLVYAVEYTLRTRLDILRLERGLASPRGLRSAIWLLGQERRRRQALRAADAVQFNGYPAARAYGALVREGLTYLDGRMAVSLMATDAEMAARAARQSAGAPLRLIHSGRLEAMKGAQDLVPVAKGLVARGIDFTLDIFGTGALVAELARSIAAAGLDGVVRLHAPVPFETGLVPRMRQEADVFLSCHRQGDPSCSYLEAMGCGLPVVGYDNEMWGAMAPVSGGGWVVPMGRPDRLAEAVAGLAADRAALQATADRALSFARQHDFAAEFRLRMAHLAEVARR